MNIEVIIIIIIWHAPCRIEVRVKLNHFQCSVQYMSCILHRWLIVSRFCLLSQVVESHLDLLVVLLLVQVLQ